MTTLVNSFVHCGMAALVLTLGASAVQASCLLEPEIQEAGEKLAESMKKQFTDLRSGDEMMIARWYGEALDHQISGSYPRAYTAVGKILKSPEATAECFPAYAQILKELRQYKKAQAVEAEAQRVRDVRRVERGPELLKRRGKSRPRLKMRRSNSGPWLLNGLTKQGRSGDRAGEDRRATTEPSVLCASRFRSPTNVRSGARGVCGPIRFRRRASPCATCH